MREHVIIKTTSFNNSQIYKVTSLIVMHTTLSEHVFSDWSPFLS